MNDNLNYNRSKLINILNSELLNKKLILGEKEFLINNYLIPQLNSRLEIKREKLKIYQLGNARTLDLKFPKQYHSNLYHRILV